MEQPTIAVDLAKSVFQVAVSRRTGHVDEERRLLRSRFLSYFAQALPRRFSSRRAVLTFLGTHAPGAGAHGAPVAGP
jgi:hypothetical protein